MNEIIVASIDDNDKDGGAPSLVELFVIDSISSSLRPTFDHVIRVLSEAISTPALVEKSEQLYFWLCLLLQSYSLLKFDAPLLERLYGIKYRDLGGGGGGGGRGGISSDKHNPNPNSHPLHLWKKTCALAAIVVVPTLVKFLRNKASSYRRSKPSSTGTSTLTSRLINFAKKTVGFSMPYVEQLFVLLESAHHIGYAAGYTMHYKLFWRILNITATRRRDALVSGAVINSPSSASSSSSSSSSLEVAGGDNNVRSSTSIRLSHQNASYSNGSGGIFKELSGASKILGIGASILLAFKALQMYTEFQNHIGTQTSRDGASGRGGGGYFDKADGDNEGSSDVSTDVTAPPRVPPVGRGCVLPPKTSGLCPLCRSVRQQPSASTGGYVFCYTCIASSIRNYGNFCPVTGEFCRLEDVIRLYGSDF